MGKINVVLADGRTISVDEKDYREATKAKGNTIEAESPRHAAERLAAEAEADRLSGAGNAIAAGVFAGADTLTAGGVGKFVGAFSEDAAKEMANVQKAHPVASAVGGIAAMALPVGAVGGAAKASEAITAATGSRALGLAGEGALLAGGGHIAGTNVSGDQLSIEGLAEDMSIGLVLNVGIGKVADKLKNYKAAIEKGGPKGLAAFDDTVITGANQKTPLANAARSQQRAEAAEALEKSVADSKTASHIQRVKEQAKRELKEAQDILDNSSAYANYRDAHNAAQKRITTANTEVKTQIKEYAKFATPKGTDDIISGKSGYEKVQAKLRERMQRAARGGTPEAEVDALRLTEMQAAIDDITKMKTAVRAAAKDDGYELAAHAINATEKRVAGLVPDMPLPKSPVIPGELLEVGPTLPDKMTELFGKRTDTIAKLATSTDEITTAELNKLASELGITPGETAGDTLTTLHKEMRNIFHARPPTTPKVELESLDDSIDLATKTERAKMKAMSDEVAALRSGGGYSELGDWVGSGGAAKGGASRASKGILDGAMDSAKSGVRFGVGRFADIGGVKGAFLRTIAGGAAGYALNGLEGAAGGAALMNGRMGIRAKVAGAFAKFGPMAGNVLGRLGPVTANAMARFPSGEEDDSADDIRDLTANRINDIMQAEVGAADNMFEVVRPMMGMENDVAYNFHQKVVRSLQYLSALAPKDPGIDVTATGSKWKMSHQQADEWNHRFEAVMHPVAYLVRTLQGDGHPSGVEALAINWPAFLQESLNEATQQDWKDLTLAQHRGLSMLFGRPMSPMQHPEVVMLLQGMHLPRPEQQEQQASRATGNPTGRPPAVQSKVAGSNVASLTA